MHARAEARGAASLDAADYSQPSAWAAYPGQPSHAEDAPAGVSKGVDQDVVVFFVHPTTYLTPVMGNAGFDVGGEVGFWAWRCHRTSGDTSVMCSR